MSNTEKTYQSKGFMTFKLDNDFELAYQTITIDDMLNHYPEEMQDALKPGVIETLTYPIYDLMTGSEFLDAVRNGCIMNNDGSLSDIFIDGYRTNLGLDEAGLSQGSFLVSGKIFEQLCNEHEVLVNWANK